MTRAYEMNFCTNCGTPLVKNVPPGDSRERHSCPACGMIHYQNPKLVVGCIPEWGDKILMCRRAIEPRYGLWTLPAGFMENGETTAEGAIRETLEEAGAHVQIGSLFNLINLPHINQVYLMFRARLLDLDYCPGTESLEVQLFSEQQIPWNDLAFLTIRQTLGHYFEDRKAGDFRFHFGVIDRKNH
jgi:ADP-ribose pyrophosphatase YjhB (NUDIX family)